MEENGSVEEKRQKGIVDEKKASLFFYLPIKNYLGKWPRLF